MVSLLVINVHYLRQKHVFNIEPTTSLSHVICLISNNFRIEPNEFLLEVLDTRFNERIALDTAYFDEIRMHPYFAKNRSLSLYIRRRRNSSSEIKLDTDYLSTQTLSETITEADHIVAWLDSYISQVDDYVPLKQYFNSIITVDAPDLFFIKKEPYNRGNRENLDIYNLIRTSYYFKCDDHHYEKYKLKGLKTFANSEECSKFLKIASATKKKVFVISSGALVQDILPDILDNACVYSLYVLFDFCLPVEQVANYLDPTSNMLWFEHDLDLLTRLTQDIATYYEDKSSSNIDPQKQLSYLRWARKLYAKSITHQGKDDPCKTSWRVEGRIRALEDYLHRGQKNDEEVQFSVECAEILVYYIA